ncbi:MAG TPA: hypothetical protein VMZ26_11660 [Pyrinomonadaceae bacterium]|nr:hypothetical protein [Pyrinomonadaceae bacterium]
MLYLRFLLIVLTSTAFLASHAEAQSGRQNKKEPAPQLVIVQPSPTPNIQTSDVPAKVASLVVTGNIVHGFGYMSSNYMDLVFKEFMTWMKYDPHPFLNLSKGGKMTLESATARSKEETDNHVLWVGIAVEDSGSGQLLVTHVDYTVLMPRTGKVLTTGRVIPGKQRIVGQGGVLTIPSMPKPSSDVTQMKQAARAVAGHLKSTAWF